MSEIKTESDSETVDIEMPATVKLPEFWPTQAALWFGRADAEFDQKGVTTEKTRYSHVVSALPVEVATRVKDALIAPDATQPYTALRKRLMDTYTLNSYQRGVALLHMPDRTTDSPTALLDAMLDYLPEEESRESPGWLFRVLFLEKLPADIRIHLSAFPDESVRELAMRGDRLWASRATMAAAPPAPVLAVQAKPAASVLPPVSPDGGAAHLCCAVRNSKEFCWYHANFGTDANGCKPPCSWNKTSKKKGNGKGGRRN